MNVRKIPLICGILMGLLSVILAAFFAHGINNNLNPVDFQRITKALNYQQIYAVLITALSYLGLSVKIESKRFWLAIYCFSIGALDFITTLYLGVFLHCPIFFKLTPIGGVLLLLSWFILLCDSFSMPKPLGYK